MSEPSMSKKAQEKVPQKKSGLNAGWILVSGLILLCAAGTGLTWWNYSQHVYSSAEGVVLEAQWPESRIAVEVPRDEASHILIGHRARITRGKETKVLQGEVASIIPKKSGAAEDSKSGPSTVIIRLLDEASQTEKGEQSKQGQHGQHSLPTGAACSVTIDTTVPPLAAASPIPSAK
jgi:hypothetical protein